MFTSESRWGKNFRVSIRSNPDSPSPERQFLVEMIWLREESTIVKPFAVFEFTEHPAISISLVDKNFWMQDLEDALKAIHSFLSEMQHGNLHHDE